MTKQDLDDLFKRGSEQYDFSYRPAAWEQMETLLEKQQRRRRLMFWWLVLLAGFVLVAAGIFWQSSDHQPQPKETAPAPAYVQTPAATPPVPSTSSIATDTPSSAPVSSPALSAKPTSPVRQSVLRISSARPGTKNSSILPVPTPASPVIAQPVQIAALAPLPRLTFSPASMGSVPVPPLVQPELVTAHSSIFHKASPLSISASYAREWNTVGFADKNKAGWKAGLHLEYQLGPKWSIGLGATYSAKDYIAGSGKYHAKADFWSEGRAPVRTLADCEVIEIPLTARYYFRTYDQPGWYAGLVIHSFFLRRETFSFTYHNPPPDAIHGWEERGTNRHLLGMAQVQAGYQTVVASRLIWQVSPYLQLPLTGIGHGTVNLFSFGLQTHLKVLIN